MNQGDFFNFSCLQGEHFSKLILWNFIIFEVEKEQFQGTLIDLVNLFPSLSFLYVDLKKDPAYRILNTLLSQFPRMIFCGLFSCSVDGSSYSVR